MDILCTGSACSTDSATIACPDSWKATISFSCGVHHPVLLLQPSDHPVDGLIEFRRSDRLLVFPGSEKGCLVDEVGEVGSHKAGGKARDLAEVDIGAQKDVPGMDFQDGFPAVYVRAVDQDLPVKPPRAQKGGVQDFRPVGGGHDDDPFVRFESVHLHQKLVERLLPLVVSPPKTFMPRAFPNASSSSMKMMQGAWPVAWEKRSRTRDAPTPTNISTNSEPLMLKKGTFASPATAFARRVLPVPGGPPEAPLWGSSRPASGICRGLQELHDFLELFLGLIDPRDVGEGDLRLALREELGLALGEGHDPLPRPHLLHGKPPDQEHDAEGEDPQKNAAEQFTLIASRIVDLVVVQVP